MLLTDDAHEADEEIIVEENVKCVQHTIEIADDNPHGALKHPSDNSQQDTSSLPPYLKKLPPHHISHTEYKTIWDKTRSYSRWNPANYSIVVHDRIPAEELLCTLGEIKFSLSEYRSFKLADVDQKNITDISLPRFLPEGKFSLFVGESFDTAFVIFDVVDGNQENILHVDSQASSYLCLRGLYHHTYHPSQFDSLEHLCRLKKGKIIKLLFKEYKRVDGTLTLSVCLMNTALFTPKFAAESNLGRSPQVQHMLKLMNWMRGYDLPGKLLWL